MWLPIVDYFVLCCLVMLYLWLLICVCGVLCFGLVVLCVIATLGGVCDFAIWWLVLLYCWMWFTWLAMCLME